MGGLPDERDFVCLATCTQSGTHWTRHFLVNYLRRQAGIEGETLFGSFLHEVYPNSRYRYVNEGVPYRPTGPLPPGIRDVVSQHGFRALDDFPGWIIAQIRNPLDFLVSNYFHRHQARVDTSLHVGGIGEVADVHLSRWARTYKALQALRRQDLKLMVVTYERLYTRPAVVFGEMLSFIEQSVDAEQVREVMAEVTGARFHAKVLATNDKPILTMPLARDGRVGQWRHQMTAADIEIGRAALARFGLDLDAVMDEWGLPLERPRRRVLRKPAPQPRPATLPSLPPQPDAQPRLEAAG